MERPNGSRDAGHEARDLERMRPYAPAWIVKPRRGKPALHRTFNFRSFGEAMWFTLKLGELAEREGQRPTILISWDCVTVALGMPDTDELDRRDFIAAANVDRLFDGLAARREAEAGLRGS